MKKRNNNNNKKTTISFHFLIFFRLLVSSIVPEKIQQALWSILVSSYLMGFAWGRKDCQGIWLDSHKKVKRLDSGIRCRLQSKFV